MNLKSASTFRRTACGLCLLMAPALLLLASILDPVNGEGGDRRKILQALKDDPDMAQISTALWAWGFALMTIGLIGVIHVIRRRGVVLAHLGGALALIGSIFLVGLITTTVTDLNQAEHLNLDTAEKLSKDVEDYWVTIVILVPALLGTLLGYILLAAALIRSKLTHIAAPILIIAGIVLIPFSEEARALGILSSVLLLGGWGLVGLKLLGMKDEEWDSSTASTGSVTPASG